MSDPIVLNNGDTVETLSDIRSGSRTMIKAGTRCTVRRAWLYTAKITAVGKSQQFEVSKAQLKKI